MSRQWIGVTLLIAVMHALWAYTVLPDRVASHWDGAGVPNGYMDRIGFISFYLWLMVGMTAVFSGIGVLIRHTPNDAINLPNREYWLSPERREATLSRITESLSAFVLLLNVFMIAVHHLSILANLTVEKQLSNVIWVLLLMFLSGTGLWVWRLQQDFKIPTQS